MPAKLSHERDGAAGAASLAKAAVIEVLEVVGK